MNPSRAEGSLKDSFPSSLVTLWRFFYLCRKCQAEVKQEECDRSYSKSGLTSSQWCYVGQIFLLYLSPSFSACKIVLSLQWDDAYVECLPPGWGSLIISLISPFSPHLSDRPTDVEGEEERRKQRSAYINIWMRAEIAFIRGDFGVCHLPWNVDQENMDKYSDRK